VAARKVQSWKTICALRSASRRSPSASSTWAGSRSTHGFRTPSQPLLDRHAVLLVTADTLEAAYSIGPELAERARTVTAAAQGELQPIDPEIREMVADRFADPALLAVLAHAGIDGPKKPRVYRAPSRASDASPKNRSPCARTSLKTTTQ
jgi:hypothetical protein